MALLNLIVPTSESAVIYSRWKLIGLALLLCATCEANASPESLFQRLLGQIQSLAPTTVPDDSVGLQSEPDFSAVNQRFQDFLDDSDIFDGISYALVDSSGSIYLKAFGDHSEDLVTMIASTSKVPAVMTLLALEEDPKSNFRMDMPIGEVFPVRGLYGDRTPLQLVSNTSGIPGLSSIFTYGVHLCQFSFNPNIDFQECGQTLFTTRLLNTREPGEAFDYGGSQWQLAGVAAALSSNKNWNQLVHEYLAAPCELEVFTFGNMWEDLTQWNGSPDGLLGIQNPNVEGGAITTLSDYAKLLSVHLNGGFCGERRILSDKSLKMMQSDYGSLVPLNPTPYGLGWFIASDYEGVFYDPGAFGSVSFIDIGRGIGGFVAIDEYFQDDSTSPVRFLLSDILPLIQSAFDSAFTP